MSNLDCEDDFELENLRLAALKSMKTKTSAKPNVNSNDFVANNNNKPQNERIFKKHKPVNTPQFNQPPSQFHNNQQFNNPQFNQFNNHPQFNNNMPFNCPAQFNNNGPFNQPSTQFINQFNNHQFNKHPNQQFNQAQFNQLPPQFTQPKSNLIVLTAGKSSNEIVNDHQMPNHIYNLMNPQQHINHMNPQQQMNHPQKHFRNVSNKQVNKRFNNLNKPHFNQNKREHKPIKDVPTDTSKNTDNLPSRFSRIDRESSSDEDDEESNSDDNDIERYRQTYDTNDANDEDTQSSWDTNELVDQDQKDKNDSNIDVLNNLKKNELTNQINQDELSNQINQAEQIDQKEQSNEEAKTKYSSDQSNLNSSISSISTFNDSGDSMVLRNKKRLSCSDQDNESSNKRLNRDSLIIKNSIVKDNSSIKDTNQRMDENSEQQSDRITKDKSQDTNSKNEVKSNSEIFYEDDYEGIDNFCNSRSDMCLNQDLPCNTRRTTRNNYEMRSVQSSNRLNSQVNVVKTISTRSQDSFDQLSTASTGNTKKLRSLIVRK